MTSQPTVSEERRDRQHGDVKDVRGVLDDLTMARKTEDAVPSKLWIEMIEEFRAERDALRTRLQAIPRVRQDAAAQLAELEAAHQSIRMARDSLLAQLHTLAVNRDQDAGKIVEFAEALDEAREKLSRKQDELDAAKCNCEELRAQIQKHEDAASKAGTFEGSHPGNAAGADFEPMVADTSGMSKAELAARLSIAGRRIAALDTYVERAREQQKEGNFRLIQKLMASEKERGAAVASEASLQEELGTVTAERDSMQLALTDLENSVAEMRMQVTECSNREDSEALIKAQQRDIADLTAQLDVARDELRLAWALMPSIESPAPGAAPSRVAESASIPLDAAGTELAVAAMSGTIAGATGSQDPAEHLATLSEQLSVLGQRALCAGWLSLRRLAESCGEIAKWLLKKPAKVALMAPLLREAFTLMSKIAASPDSRVHEDTDGFEVYALDDDVDNCECIAVALDKIGLRTSYASKPNIAIKELGARQSKLILLDVRLGGEETGFDVHKVIRKMPHHERTPILFVTGLSSAGQQIAADASANDSYLAKPYNLNELSLKALSMILQSRLAA